MSDIKKPADFADVGPGGVSNLRSGTPRADFSDVSSGSSSTAPAAPAVTPGRTYTVVKGDSLSKIAKRLLGKANLWPRIYEANRSIIKDPDLIYPGQVLTIPEP